ncbi:Protein DA1 [Forsythia ovata]|uniref:Protein DA1 n=1 Tax=Forsythia ovata TaxID=205694 RepID=A0ABD1RMU1_9LAMI
MRSKGSLGLLLLLVFTKEFHIRDSSCFLHQKRKSCKYVFCFLIDSFVQVEAFLDYELITISIMAWLNKIFERPNQKVSKGRYDPRNGSDTEDTWSETEDRDHAIALSLSEEDHNAKNGTVKNYLPRFLKHWIDCNSQLEEDEDLARALQESLNVESPQDSDGNNNGTRNENLSTYLRPLSLPSLEFVLSFVAMIGLSGEVQQGREPTDVDFCSTAIEGGLENDILQQRLHTVLKQREQLQHMEIGLRAQLSSLSTLAGMGQRRSSKRTKQRAPEL